jgi:hypothetical protein
MSRKSPFEWLVDKLADSQAVKSTTILSDSLLKVVRTNGVELKITSATLDKFHVADVKKILDAQIADCILHTSKEPFIDGDVLDYLDSQKVVLGGFGDVLRLISQDSNWPYEPPDVRFILRGLRQHTRVSSVRRLDNKRYEISRVGLRTVTIISLDDYDLGIESIRNAVDKFDHFDAVLKSNPNGRITSTALTLADSRKIKAFMWGELMGNLNSEWNWRQ